MTASDKPQWTEEELKEFDRLTWMESSRNQLERINGRLRLREFIEKHGRAKCDAMFAHLTKGEKS